MSADEKNKNVNDVAENYSEQSDVQSKDDAVKEFLHSNGKKYPLTQYQEEFGEIKMPEGFEKLLEGKTLEEQMEHYAILERMNVAKSAYGEITSEMVTERGRKLCDCKEVEELIVKGETLVGVVFKGYWKIVYLLPCKSVLTYYASDNDGAGYNEREDYAFLVCLNEQKEVLH
jgi:hypothetical protein